MENKGFHLRIIPLSTDLHGNPPKEKEKKGCAVSVSFGTWQVKGHPICPYREKGRIVRCQSLLEFETASSWAKSTPTYYLNQHDGINSMNKDSDVPPQYSRNKREKKKKLLEKPMTFILEHVKR
jgi:hypothetical protein